MEKIKVLIVDDHEIVRVGLRHILSQDNRYELVGEAAGVAEVMRKVDMYRPDIVLMDIRMPDGSGIDASQQLVEKYPEIKIIMLTSYKEDNLIRDAILAGARGFLLKDADFGEILKALDVVSLGGSLIDPAVTMRVLGMIKQQQKVHDDWSNLTIQEKNVLVQLAAGKSNKTIAEELFLSHRTVKNYVSNVLKKLDLRNRSEAVAYAIRNNVVDRVGTNRVQ